MSNLDRWNKAKFTRSSQINAQAAKIEANRSRYEAVSAKTGVPWDVIGVIHYRESSGSFAGVLHNGQKIIGTGKKTTIVPKGRGPFSTWEEAAVDALMNCHPYAGKNKDWSIAGTLDILERYNGLGYRKKGLPSPYLWAGTDQYVKGKYVADGKYDPNHVDKQLGVAPILMRLREGKSTAPAPKPAPAAPVGKAEASSEETIKAVQQLLRDKGYPETGNVDGAMGNRTRNAILAFQADNGLPLTGEISDSLLADLVKAKPREVSQERATATAKDLKGAESVKQGEWLKRLGMGVLVSSGIGGLLDGTGDIEKAITGIGKVRALTDSLLSLSPWLLGAVAGSAAIWFGSRFIKEQVRAYREGRHV